MALADNFRSNLTKSRGLDPRALATLDARKNSRAKREDELKRKQTEREISGLRARLAVINREIQRLSVSERRYHGDAARAQQEFETEAKNVLELTKELGRHSSKVKELQQALNAKKVLTSKAQKTSDFGREAAEKESERLRTELKRIDQEIDQLNSRRRRITAEMSSFQQKVQKASEMEMKSETEMRRNEGEISKILQELQSEESVLDRFKARFSVEQKTMIAKQNELQNVKKRMQGAGSGSPELESERQRIEQQIRELERKLN